MNIKSFVSNLPIIDFFYAQFKNVIFKQNIPSLSTKDASIEFIKYLNNSKFYCEFGSGTSTIFAANKKLKFISVENSKPFFKSLNKIIDIKTKNYERLYINTGLTRSWGIPFLNKVFYSKKKVRKYCLENKNFRIKPDIILIDGRYRVATTLSMIKNKNFYQKTIFIIDDYVDREYYKVLENYIEIKKTVGKSIFCFPKSNINFDYLKKDYEVFLEDWR